MGHSRNATNVEQKLNPLNYNGSRSRFYAFACICERDERRETDGERERKAPPQREVRVDWNVQFIAKKEVQTQKMCVLFF